MKAFVVFSALVASTFAQSYFGIMSARSASPVHLLPLTARGSKFYLGGGPPSSYCPPQVGETCTSLPGNSTVLAGGNGTLALGVVVPGGQQVYIAPDGSMSYTVPHSAYTPEGSVLDGWKKTAGEGDSFGNLSFKDGLVACPGKEGEGYQVFGKIEGANTTDDCLGFSSLVVEAEGPSAWEY